MSDFLKIKEEALKTVELYKNDKRQNSFNLLLLGETGTGKTYITRTARKPIHVDSFDPGGTKGIRPMIERGELVVDSRFEGDDPKNPQSFELWMKEFKRRKEMGYFNHFGTYVLDSATTWSDSIMHWIMKKDGVAGEAPRWTKDYGPQKVMIKNWLSLCLDLPCDFILTGHLQADKDEVSGAITYRFLTTGQGVVTIPLLFDEIYVAITETMGRDQVNYYILTRRTGKYLAATRLGKEVFKTYEEPNIKNLLTKAGLPATDKPLFK